MQKQNFHRALIVSRLGCYLFQEIEHHNLKSLVNKVDFLSNGDPDFVIDVIERLKFEVYLPGDVIIKAGSRGRAMFFIEHGTVEINIDGEVVASLNDGAHFGGMYVNFRVLEIVHAAIVEMLGTETLMEFCWHSKILHTLLWACLICFVFVFSGRRPSCLLNFLWKKAQKQTKQEGKNK